MRKHLFLPKTPVVEKNIFLTELAHGKKVLDIGLGGYISDSEVTAVYLEKDLTGTLHGHLTTVVKELKGIDINPRCVQKFSQLFPNNTYVVADVTEHHFVEAVGENYDLIVFGDVLEHLDSFRPALANLKSLLTEDGQIVITTVNAYAFAPLIKMLFRYDSVHEEHTAYFSYMTIRRLLEMNGMEIIDFRFYGMARKKFDSLFDAAAYYCNSFFMKIFPQYAPGIVCVARPEDRRLQASS